ncbi:MAG: hypothetical protein V4613_09325 [Bacteroidota bacterium]
MDLKIAGIKANLQAYQVAWQVNALFDMQLGMNIDWQIEVKDKGISDHLHFFQAFEDVELNWHLVQNRGTAGSLFNSKPPFDYFLICTGDDMYGYFERAMEAIKTSNRIDGIYQFQFSMIKASQHFYNNLQKSKQFSEFLHV